MATVLRGLRINRVAHVDKGAGDGVEILIMKRADEIDDSEYVALTKRTFTADERKAAEASGAAMSGGRYPIESVADLENAIRAVGRGTGSHAAIRAHIISRAKTLGASDKIPDTWTKSGVKKLLDIVTSAFPSLAPQQAQAMAEAFEKADVSAILAEDTDGDIKMFDQLLSDQSARQAIWDANSALSTSVCSIMEDDEVDGPGKLALLQETLQEYTTHMLTLVGGALAKSSARTSEGDGKSMSEITKALGLKDDASAEDIAKALGDAAFGVNVAKMSDKHTAFMNNEKAKMPDGGKKAFASMEPNERDAHMEKNPVASDEPDEDDIGKSIAKGLAFRTPEGSVVTKAAAGPLFDVMKAQNDQRIADRAEIAKMRDAGEVSEITKRVEPLVNIAKADELGGLLHSIGKHDPKLADQVEALLKTANTRIEKGDLFAEQGSGARGVVGDATAAITAQAQALVLKAAEKGERLSIEKARTQIRDAHPELVEQERAQTARRAA